MVPAERSKGRRQPRRPCRRCCGSLPSNRRPSWQHTGMLCVNRWRTEALKGEKGGRSEGWKHRGRRARGLRNPSHQSPPPSQPSQPPPSPTSIPDGGCSRHRGWQDQELSLPILCRSSSSTPAAVTYTVWGERRVFRETARWALAAFGSCRGVLSRTRVCTVYLIRVIEKRVCTGLTSYA